MLISDVTEEKLYKEQEMPLPMTPLSRKSSRARNAYYDPASQFRRHLDSAGTARNAAEYGNTVGIYFDTSNKQSLPNNAMNTSYLSKRINKDEFNSSMDNLDNLHPSQTG